MSSSIKEFEEYLFELDAKIAEIDSRRENSIPFLKNLLSSIVNNLIAIKKFVTNSIIKYYHAMMKKCVCETDLRVEPAEIKNENVVLPPNLLGMDKFNAMKESAERIHIPAWCRANGIAIPKVSSQVPPSLILEWWISSNFYIYAITYANGTMIWRPVRRTRGWKEEGEGTTSAGLLDCLRRETSQALKSRSIPLQ